MLGISLIVAAIFYTSNFLFFREFDVIADNLQLPVGHPFRDFIDMQKGKSFNFFLLTGLGSTLFILISGAFFSHRIAGPIYRINNLLKEMAQNGEVKHVQIRKTDFFQELPQNINLAIDTIKKAQLRSIPASWSHSRLITISLMTCSFYFILL